LDALGEGQLVHGYFILNFSYVRKQYDANKAAVYENIG
jgi:hypothetical protein